MSRNDVAKAVGVSLSAVDKWLQGNRPSRLLMPVVAGALRVNGRWLDEGIDDRNLQMLDLEVSASSWSEYLTTTIQLREAYDRAKDELKTEFVRRKRRALADLKSASEGKKNPLQDMRIRVSLQEMEPLSTLPEVLESLLGHAKEVGGQKALAALLKVSPQQLNDWLSGRIRPGGERLLRLRAWALAREKNQNRKGSEGASTPSKPKARKPRKSTTK